MYKELYFYQLQLFCFVLELPTPAAGKGKDNLSAEDCLYLSGLKQPLWAYHLVCKYYSNWLVG